MDAKTGTATRTESIRHAMALFLVQPEVQQCYYSNGGISFFVIIVPTDMSGYQALAKRLFEHNPASTASAP